MLLHLMKKCNKNLSLNKVQYVKTSSTCLNAQPKTVQQPYTLENVVEVAHWVEKKEPSKCSKKTQVLNTPQNSK